MAASHSISMLYIKCVSLSLENLLQAVCIHFQDPSKFRGFFISTTVLTLFHKLFSALRWGDRANRYSPMIVILLRTFPSQPWRCGMRHCLAKYPVISDSSNVHSRNKRIFQNGTINHAVNLWQQSNYQCKDASPDHYSATIYLPFLTAGQTESSRNPRQPFFAGISLAATNFTRNLPLCIAFPW